MFLWSLAFGIPATAAGALATRWIDGAILIGITDVVIALLGLRFLLAPSHCEEGGPRPTAYRLRLAAVAILVGVASGLLANSGGFCSRPLSHGVATPDQEGLRHVAGCRFGAGNPGTLVHWRLGHIDWKLVLVFGAASVPLSYLGARVALRTDAVRLERLYGAALVGLGLALLAFR